MALGARRHMQYNVLVIPRAGGSAGGGSSEMRCPSLEYVFVIHHVNESAGDGTNAHTGTVIDGQRQEDGIGVV